MPSSGILCRAALARTDVSEERSISIFRVTRTFLRSLSRLLISANVVSSSPNLVKLMMEALRSSETSVLTEATRRYIPENSILLLREDIYKYIQLTAITEHSMNVVERS
jgi:hypothetical protein